MDFLNIKKAIWKLIKLNNINDLKPLRVEKNTLKGFCYALSISLEKQVSIL